MQNLNSSLIQGVLKDEPQLTVVDGYTVARFTLFSKSFHKKPNGGEVDIESHIPVVVEGKLAESCGKLGKEGRGVRVVGRLYFPENGGAEVMAEHVEFRVEK